MGVAMMMLPVAMRLARVMTRSTAAPVVNRRNAGVLLLRSQRAHFGRSRASVHWLQRR